MTPKRIQRKRTAGWKMPDNTVYVGRPSKWGNPFKVGDASPNNYSVIIDRDHAVQLFLQTLEAKQEYGLLEEFLKPLKGKNLACWCKEGSPCHADVLLELANKEP